VALEYCCGWSCTRMISLSVIRGGNPVALRDPEHFAVDFGTCEDCKVTFCDRCVARKSRMFARDRCHECRGRLLPTAQRERALNRPWPEAVTEYNTGHEHRLAGDHEDALAAFDRAVRLRPDYVSAHHWRGIALKQLGRDREALAALDRVAELDRGHVQAMFDAAVIHIERRRWTDAVGLLDRVLATEPRYVGARVNRAVSLRNVGRFQEALAESETAIRIQKDGRAVDRTPYILAYAYGAQGAALMALARYADALVALDVAIESGPDDSAHYRNRGVVLEKLGRLEEARVSFRIATEIAAGQ
jgi:tetratricopeptide (TPR) repeat protein